jgi:hypothetical protein
MSNVIITPFLRGGLGNYIFQIATSFATSVRDNKTMLVNTSDVSVIHSPLETYLNNIFRKIKFVDGVDCQHFHEPVQAIQYELIPNYPGNTKLMGYYQNETYFNHLRNEVLDLFEIDEETKEMLLQKYGDILNLETCSLHVRRGNYVERQQYHPLQTVEYYTKSIETIGKDKHYLIFSDDIQWCKENLSFIENKTFVEGNKDYEDLYLMSFCKDNIIANSSFSWWGAWLNKNNNKRVIYPSVWFGNNGQITDGIGCVNWIRI